MAAVDESAMGDQINIDREGAAIAKAIKSMLTKAKKAGVAKPMVYFESEGSVHVVDADKPLWGADQQAAVVGSFFLGVPYDVGAW